jgi:hypothetical protein
MGTTRITNRQSRRASVVGTAVIVSIAALLVPLLAGSATASAPGATMFGPACQPAGTTGLTTSWIAKSGERIQNVLINAAGCDVGIYVGPGANGVTISHVVVTGANEHAIFAQDVKDLTIRGSTVYNNSFHTYPAIAENKAIEVVGTWHATLIDNTVVNNGYGGIGIADDGPFDPGAINPGYAHAAVGNVVQGNLIANNSNDCGIVVAAYNAGLGVRNNQVIGNTVLGNSPTAPGPAVGQIVVATDGPNTSAKYNWIMDNVIDGSLLPGIVVHANVPGDLILYTHLIDNTILNNGAYPPSFSSPNTPNLPGNYTGISIVAEAYGQPDAPVITHTLIGYDSVANDWYGVWLCQSVSTIIVHLSTASVLTPVMACSAGGN